MTKVSSAGPTPEASPAGGPELSLVVPMLNEAEVIPILFSRLREVLDPLGIDYEVICVDDGSRDGTAAVIAAENQRDRRIRAICLSRNFGKEIALTAGLDVATGRAVVPLDADLQDPPELIPQFLDLWRQGYDVVYGVRTDRDRDTWAKRNTSRAFYRVMNRVSGVEIPFDAGDFRLMDRRVVTALRELRERNRFMKGLFSWVGFRSIPVEYQRPERAAGQTKFGYWRLWNFALDGITGFSTLPLRIAGYIGLFVALASLSYGLWLVLRTLLWGIDVPGYASVMVAVLFMGGIQLVVLGIIGEYIGRVFEETKQRPLYVVKERIGLAEPALAQNAAQGAAR